MEKQLPKNWVEVSLKEVTNNRKGKKPNVQSEVEFDGSIPYMDIKALEHNIIRQYADIESSKLFEEGDIAMVWDGARSGWVSKTNMGAIGSTLVAFKPILFNSNYLYFYLLDKYPFINSNARGVGIPHVDPTVLWDLKFPLSPLPEQNRIVEKLDNMFNQIETIKTSMANIPLLLKDFRQQILTQAVTGKLTEEWRNENNSKDWKLTKVGKFMKEVKDKIDPTNIDEVPYLGLEHIRKDGGIIAIGISSDLKSNKTVFKKNDVLYGKLRPYLNKHDVVKFDGICSTDILVYRNDNIYSCIFFNYFLGNSAIIEKLNGEAKGINLPRVSASIVNNLDIKIPSSEEQKEIVYRVESLLDKANAIEQQYKLLKDKIDKLPQALLHKAFKGELTQQLQSDGDAKELLKAIAELKNLKGTKPKAYKAQKEKLRLVAEPK